MCVFFQQSNTHSQKKSQYVLHVRSRRLPHNPTMLLSSKRKLTNPEPLYVGEKKKHIFIVISPLQVRQQRRNMWVTMTLWSKSRHRGEGHDGWRCLVSWPVGNERKRMFMFTLLYCPLTPRNPRTKGTPELRNRTGTMGGFWVLRAFYSTTRFCVANRCFNMVTMEWKRPKKRHTVGVKRQEKI